MNRKQQNLSLQVCFSFWLGLNLAEDFGVINKGILAFPKPMLNPEMS